MIDYNEALARIARLPQAGDTCLMDVGRACGQILAEDVRLSRDQPPFDRATMDGFAVSQIAGRTCYQVIGTVRAGTTWDAAVPPGTALRIMTGAPCPEGTTVVPYEQVQEQDAQITIPSAALGVGRNIAWRGEDGRQGAVIVPAGMRLTPATIAAAAMCGRISVLVQKPPRVVVITTGDEVGSTRASGIADSNGPFLESFCQLLGLPVERLQVRDELPQLCDALANARARAEVVVTSGGVSGAATDLVPEAARLEGFEVVFHQVAMQPGKPVLMGCHGSGTLLAALPGNAVSVLATAHLLLLPLLAHVQKFQPIRWLELPLTTRHEHVGKRRLFLPARACMGGVEAIAWHGSGDLIAAASGDGLIDLLPGTRHELGSLVRFLPYVGTQFGSHGLPLRVESSAAPRIHSSSTAAELARS